MSLMELRTLIISSAVGSGWALFSSGYLWSSGFIGSQVALAGYLLALPSAVSLLIWNETQSLFHHLGIDSAILSTSPADTIFWLGLPIVFGTVFVYLILTLGKSLSKMFIGTSPPINPNRPLAP